MEFARKSEKNEDGNFIDKFTGDVMDVSFEIKTATLRINKKLHGLTKNIKGVVMEKLDETISEKLDNIATPDPEKDKDIKKEKKGLAKIVECLFDTLLDDIKDFIENLLKDLFERALDSALCLIQDILGQIMNKLMDLIDKALSAIEGVVSKIKGAMDMIEGLIQNIADLLDLFCDGELTCASKASTYET